MPLSNTGNKLKREFKKRYGKDKGEEVFYATENSHPEFANAVTKSDFNLIPESCRWLITNLLKAPIIYDDEGIGKAAYPVVRKKFMDFPISIENEKGSTRHWKQQDGLEGHTTMLNDYGYFRMTEGLDGDHLDCFLGDNEEAQEVYVITTNHSPEFVEEDEQKVMLGFPSESEAVDTFKKHYNDPRFLRSVKTIPIHEFRAKLNKVADQKNKFVVFKAVI